MIQLITINIDQAACQGVYLRWWFNGWHYFNFAVRYEIEMRTKPTDVQVMQVFSRISKIERPTKTTTDYALRVVADGITEAQLDGFANLLIAERVEQYEGGTWRTVDITRGEIKIRTEDSPAYSLDFEITRKELPDTPAVFQNTTLLYVGDTLADLDDDEVIAITKQVNDIAELQDRQADFTATFKIRKSRAMRELFELSGEVGAATNFPYEQQTCKLVQDGIEIIGNGLLVLLRVDAQYYHVALYSGNKNIFDALSRLKLTDLTLASTNHTWNEVVQAFSQSNDYDYLYPLVEPSDDAALLAENDDGDRVVVDSDKIWPFIRVSTVFNEIFSNAGYTVTGEFFSTPLFLNLWMPIVNLRAGDTRRYFYSLYNNVTRAYSGITTFNPAGNVIINGNDDTQWRLNGNYVARYTATYRVRVYVIHYATLVIGTNVKTYVRKAFGTDEELTRTQTEVDITAKRRTSVYEGEIALTAGESFVFRINSSTVYYYDLSITDIVDAAIGYGSSVTPALNMPEMTQADFVKNLCNMAGLVPEANPRDKRIEFWNYQELYDNIPVARDWSAFLSEADDESEFKFGDYARLNYMRYKESEDVIKDNGTGVLEIADETLPPEKDIIKANTSYSDEVIVLTDVIISRIAFFEYQANDGAYLHNDKIDPRIVYVERVREDLTVSPPYQKTLAFKGLTGFMLEWDCTSPKKASSLPISFSSLAARYASLARMLTRTNLRRARFNLPAYEVAGFKHKIPVYLSQYKAYFYVNKINNYVVGRLCTVDLIKL